MTNERKILIRALAMIAQEHGNTISEMIDWLENDTDFAHIKADEIDKLLVARFPQK